MIVFRANKKTAPFGAAYFRDNYFYQALADMGLQPLPTKDHPAVLVPYSCRHTFSDLLKNIHGADVVDTPHG